MWLDGRRCIWQLITAIWILLNSWLCRSRPAPHTYSSSVTPTRPLPLSPPPLLVISPCPKHLLIICHPHTSSTSRSPTEPTSSFANPPATHHYLSTHLLTTICHPYTSSTPLSIPHSPIFCRAVMSSRLTKRAKNPLMWPNLLILKIFFET